MKRGLKKACLQRLHDTFGLTEFRPGQAEAVQALLSGRDAMCILPTGAGKSLCWQLPAMVHGGLTVVVSPLIALMRDQVLHLSERGIAALSLDSLMDVQERQRAMQQLRSGNVGIVFVSPERLMQPSFRRLCDELAPWLVVVDEAHCIVQWGEHFRPAYGEIGSIIDGLAQRPVLCALTATADTAMQHSIRESLGMRRAKLVWLPVIRENLTYEVRTTLNVAEDILRLMRERPCKTVVFCRTRLRTEQLSRMLNSRGINADCYHAGQSRETRQAAQQRFMEGSTDILCATSAFGMGVDVPGIRRIIHEDVPDSVTDYAQQTGRAGRDGNGAECILYLEPIRMLRRGNFRSRDRNILRRWLRNLKRRWELRQMLKIVFTADCIPSALAAAFGQRAAHCGQCSACRYGALMQHAPELIGKSDWQVRAFFLRWQRDAIARQRGCGARQVLSDAALVTAAKKLVIPQNVPAPPELDRMLRHFRQERTHDLP